MLTAARELAKHAIASAARGREGAHLRPSRQRPGGQGGSRTGEDHPRRGQTQLKQALAEATTRASLIHHGAKRLLSLLTSRHAQTMAPESQRDRGRLPGA